MEKYAAMPEDSKTVLLDSVRQQFERRYGHLSEEELLDEHARLLQELATDLRHAIAFHDYGVERGFPVNAADRGRMTTKLREVESQLRQMETERTERV